MARGRDLEAPPHVANALKQRGAQLSARPSGHVVFGALLVEAVFEQMSPLIFGSEACCQKCTPWENGDMAISAGPQYGPVRLRPECAVATPPPDGSAGCVGTI